MTFKEIEKLVIEKAEFPKTAEFDEAMCYLALQNLYSSCFSKNIIEKEQAKQERIQLKNKFEHMVWLRNQYTAVYAQKQEFIRKVKRYRPDILNALHERTDGNAVMYMMIHCISDILQDELFRKTALKMLEENYETRL